MYRNRIVITSIATVFLAISGVRSGWAQTSLLGTNLVINPGAEGGAAATAVNNLVGSIPGWTRNGQANVLPYGLTDYLQSADPSPEVRGFNYFMAVNGTATLVQDIDISAAAAAINTGNITYDISAYLGKAFRADYNGSAQVAFVFKNASGQNLGTAPVLGPLPAGTFGDVVRALYRQELIGLVPVGAVKVTVTVTLTKFNSGVGAADNISLVLTPAGASSVLDRDLIMNGNAEAGAGVARPGITQDMPGWSRSAGATVTPYGGTGWIGVTSPGPTDRAVNLFCGDGEMHQNIDVSNAAKLIDAGQVKYTVAAWMGGLNATTTPTLTYLFFDWSDKQLAPTASLGPSVHTGIGLIPLTATGVLPSGTRRVRISITFPNSNYAADDISFSLTSPNATPAISTGGVITAGGFGAFNSFAPGSWIEIYGSNLAPLTRSWTGADIIDGKAPAALDGVRVSIGGIPAFLDYISPRQVVALVPSSVPTGPGIPVTVSNVNGTSDPYMAVINPVQPGLLAPGAFTVAGNQYVAALFPDGQTFVLPQGAIAGVPSRPARPGETITLYGVGFGPVDSGFTAGTLVSGPNNLTTPLQFFFGTTPAANPSYQGLAPSAFGLYQFNVVVPNVPASDVVPLSFDLGGTKGSQKLVIAIQN